MSHAPANRAAQRRERSLKRKWLASSQPASLLDQITDDEWVAYAALDAVETPSSRPRSELASLLDQGIKRTQSAASAIRSSGVALHDEVAVLGWMAERENRSMADLLEIRARLLKRQRMLQLWAHLHGGGQPSSLPSLSPSTQEEADPWDQEEGVIIDAAGPSIPMDVGLDDFLAQSPAEHALDLALDLDVDGLHRLAQALDASSLTEVAARRFEVAEALMHVAISASKSAALEQAAQLALLPGAGPEGTERSIWLQRIKQSPAANDIVDQPGVRAALWQTDDSTTAKASSSSNSNVRSALSALDLHPRDANGLASWYVSQLSSLEEATGQVDPILALSNLVSGPLGLGNDEELRRIAADLQGVSALAQSGSRWTLRDFSEASTSSQGRRKLQRAFLKASKTPEHASTSIERGLKPFVARGTGKATEAMQSQLVDLCVSLLDEEDRSHALVVISATLSHLTKDDAAKLALAALYSTTEASADLLPGLASICTAALITSESLSKVEAKAAAALLPPSRGGSVPLASGIRSILQPCSAHEVNLLSRLAHSHLSALDVFARFGVPLSPASLVAATGHAEQQKKLVGRAVGAFGRDKGRRKTVMDWARLWQELQTVAGEGRALDGVESKTIAAEMLLSLLGEGDFSTFTALLPSLTLLSEEEVESIVIEASHSLYDRATSANLHHGDMKLAYDTLASIPSTPTLKKERAFIEATSRLCSYRIPSKLRTGANVTPIEIRLCQDRLELIARLLASRDDTYRTPDLILDLAVKLCGVPAASLDDGSRSASQAATTKPAPTTTTTAAGTSLLPRPLVEIRTYAMLSDAATAAGDVETASTFCESLVERITALRKRAQRAAVYEGGGVTSGAVAGAPSSNSASTLLPEAQEIGWKTCLQLAKHPAWQGDTAIPMSLMSHVLSLCPANLLSGFLDKWRALDEEFRSRMESDEEFREKVVRRQADMLKRSGSAASASAMASGGGGWTGLITSRGGGAGASAAGAGLGSALSSLGLESYASPFSSLFASAGLTRSSSNPSSGAPTSASASASASRGLAAARGSGPNSTSSRLETTTFGTGATKPKSSAPVGGFGRAAQLFDAFGEASSAATAAYYDPAERAALAARKIFRGFAGGGGAGAGVGGVGNAQVGGHQAQGQDYGGQGEGGLGGGGAGFSLSRGVGWLMGEDERSTSGR